MNDFVADLRFLHIQHEIAARLRHIAGTKWIAARYLNMKRLAEREKGADMEVAMVGRVFPSGDVILSSENSNQTG